MFKPLRIQVSRRLQQKSFIPLWCRSYASAPGPFDWRDPLKSSELCTEEELAIAETAESYCQERMAPRVLG